MDTVLTGVLLGLAIGLSAFAGGLWGAILADWAMGWEDD